MKMQLKRMVFIGISLMVFSSIGFAEILYVPDGKKLGLRVGPSRESKLIAVFRSGEKLEILEPGDDWSRVRLLSTGQGTVEGYLLTKYLITEERWRQIIEAERKRLEERKLRLQAGMSDKDSGAKFTMVDKDSGAKFTISIQMSYGCKALAIGEIPEHIDLTDDTVAKELLRKGYMFAKSNCPGLGRSLVVLRKASFGIPWLVKGKVGRSGSISKWDYRNKAKELAKEEQKKVEAKKQKAAANKRLKQFEKKYGVTDWPVMKDFSVNPFIYEGKKVAFVSEFETMLSATEGVFECSGELFIVSDIPKGFFTKEAEVVITGRPLGKKETKLPLLGKVLVPNLKFVGAYFCEKQHCRDIVWK